MPYIVEEDALAKKEESKIQLARRDHEEKSTEQRAAILGMPYLDTRPFENDLDLIKDGMMTIEDILLLTVNGIAFGMKSTG